jgi:uncharacterized membrane protein YkvA (DUF1232 family)
MVNMDRWRELARALKRELGALLLAWRDSRTPWYARLAALGVVAYALSPLDLIPDPIPVLGYLDDLILLPLGIWLALRLIPTEVMTDARRRIASGETVDLAHPRLAAAVIVALWIVAFALGIWLVARYL